jgi:hypothetical protein
VRRHASFRLGLELRALRAAGVDVVLFEPDPAVLAVMGNEWMSWKRVSDITRAAFCSTQTLTRSPEVRAAFSARKPAGPAEPVTSRSA